jgi:predicted lipoprotein with Yx(FWY)xxD motif
MTTSTQGALMRRLEKLTPVRSSTRAALLVIAITALLAPTLASAGQASKRVAKKADNATLGKTILTNTKGRTLYSLSVEKHGKFICTGSCTGIWHPLLIPAGVKPTGPVALGTVKRPEGKTQVTFKGRPLYRFGGDTKAGDVKGEGIKDVGTWHAAVVSKPAATPAPQPQPETPPYPY